MISRTLNNSPLWLDCNSCAADTKRKAAAEIELHGGRYVDVAVMASVYPKLHKVPLLISSEHASAGQAVLHALDMCPQFAGTEVGQASAIKMIRSIMIKGMEALSAECFLVARRVGVEDQLLSSLSSSNPEIDWPARGSYDLERMIVHGHRRAAEMREVALTVQQLGLPNGMSTPPAQLHDQPWIVPREGTPSRDQFDSVFEHTKPVSIVECGPILLMREILRRTDLIGCISSHQAKTEIENGLLVALDTGIEWEERPIGLTFREGWLPTRAQKQLLDLVRKSARSTASV